MTAGSSSNVAPFTGLGRRLQPGRLVAEGLAGGRPGWQLPDLLVDFLEFGCPPVFIGFGSITPTAEPLHDVPATVVRPPTP